MEDGRGQLHFVMMKGMEKKSLLVESVRSKMEIVAVFFKNTGEP